MICTDQKSNELEIRMGATSSNFLLKKKKRAGRFVRLGINGYITSLILRGIGLVRLPWGLSEPIKCSMYSASHILPHRIELVGDRTGDL